MQAEDYMTGRVDDQIAWYGRKSAINKRYHLWTNGGIIFFSAMIPLIAGLDAAIQLPLLQIAPNLMAGLLGVITATLSGFSALMKFQDKWTNYRMTREALMREKILYQTATAPYQAGPRSYNLFVSNVEHLLSQENTGWYSTMSLNQAPPDSATEESQ